MPTTVGDPLTCEWLQSANNCWVAALEVIASCPTGLGTLSADGLSCADTSKSDTATFAPPPLPNPVSPGRLIDYQVKGDDGGASCYSASFHAPLVPAGSTSADITVTTPAGCNSLVFGDTALTLTCPDGATHTCKFADLLACHWPGYNPGAGSKGFSVSFYWGPNALGKNATDLVDGLSCAF